MLATQAVRRVNQPRLNVTLGCEVADPFQARSLPKLAPL